MIASSRPPSPARRRALNLPSGLFSSTKRGRQGFQQADNARLGAMNIAYNFQEPQSAFVRFFHSAAVSPVGANCMASINPEVDRLIEAAEQAFDLDKQNRLLANVHEIIVEDAPWVFIVHDSNPRALSPKVKGFVQPQSWFVDSTLPWVERARTQASPRIITNHHSSEVLGRNPDCFPHRP